MYRHHTFEERLNIVSRIICGESIESLCRDLKLDHHGVLIWYLRYKKYGEAGLRGTHSYNYTTEEKLAIVKEFVEKGVFLQEICLRYDLSRSTIRKWVRLYRQGFSLENQKRGRPPKIQWQDRRKENHRQNLRSFRRRTFV